MNELMDLKERMEHERPAQWHELPDIALLWIRSSPICPGS